MAVRPTLVRLFWFAGYWLAGVVAVSIVAAGIRFWLVP